MKKQKGVFRYPEFIGVRVDKEMYEALEKASEEIDRPIASIVRIAVKDWLEARGEKGAKKKTSS